MLLLSLALGVAAVQQSEPLTKEARFSPLDYALLAAGFCAFILATERMTHGGAALWLLFAASALALAGFARRSARSDWPLLRLSVFRERTFVYCLLFVLLIQFCVLALGFLIPNYSQLAGGESARTAGLLLLPGCLLGALMAPFAGRLLDRFGAARPVLGGSVLVIVALLLFAVCGRVLTTPLFMLFYTLYACGQGLAVGNAMTHGLRHLPLQLSADGNAVLNTLQQLAGAVGTSVAASIVAAAQAHAPDDLARGTLTGSQYAFFGV